MDQNSNLNLDSSRLNSVDHANVESVNVYMPLLGRLLGRIERLLVQLPQRMPWERETGENTSSLQRSY